jgi:putative aldouronate transport system substrate-binding protein
MRATLLVGPLLTGLLSGCYGAVGSDKSNKSSQQPTESITVVINDLGMTFPPGLDENNNPYLKYIEDNTQLDVHVQIPPKEVYEEKLNVLMTSDRVPDMLDSFNNVWVDSNIKQGTLLPLDDLIDKYGPELKAKIPQEAWDRVRYNGKIYAIPSLNEVKGTELMYGRKDWLDRLGLKPPVTLDDYYNVIKAFTLDDPDGNGLNDTYGLILTEILGRSAPFFGAFGTQLDEWLERDGKLVYGSVLPETKEALQFLNRLYKEKLLDPEFPLNKNSTLNEKIAGGKVGLFSAAWYDTRGPIDQNKAMDPNAQWTALEFPTGPQGKNGVYSNDLIRGYNVIPVRASNPEGVIRFLNFIVGKGYKDLKLGFENEIWSMVDGKMVTNFSEHNKHLYRGMYQSLVDVNDPVLDKERLDSLGDFHLFDNLQTIEKHLIPNLFYGVPTPSMANDNWKKTSINELFIKIIVGVEPIDSFDRFVESWYREGGSDITREVNEWYKDQKDVKSNG